MPDRISSGRRRTGGTTATPPASGPAGSPGRYWSFQADDPLITAAVVASAIAPRFDPAGLTLAEMGQSSHWPHIERPAAVAGEIDRFLDRME
jgi:pimeloyl-ACP methyl ester carboxylesterase